MTTRNLKIVMTQDGSPTIEAGGLHYHSMRGAMQESEHVFIGAGLLPAINAFPNAELLCIFEMGFGTGLNALLTAQVATQQQRAVSYTTVEAFPLPAAVWQALDYSDTLLPDLHSTPWNKPVALSPAFTLEKRAEKLEGTYLPADYFHCIYFDAFAPDDAPELWTETVFEKLYDALLAGGLLVTYCSKGVVRRTLQAVGFRVEKVAGPPGKREMVRAWKG